jgi:hypothetical protein
VVGVHLAVEEKDARNLHGFNDGIDFGLVAAFGKIGNAFNQSIGHESEDKGAGNRRQSGIPYGREA